MKASRTDPIIKRILAATYPEYKGRKIRVDGHGSICDCQAFEQQMCERCGQEPCPHGICECGDECEGAVGFCPDCYRRRQLELDADREVAWQRDVIGPMFGFTVICPYHESLPEEKPVRVPDGWAFWDGDRVVPCESYEAVVAAIRKAKGER